MADASDNLWEVTQSATFVDADALAAAVDRAVSGASIDARTRLLVRDSVEALRQHWGEPKLTTWIDNSPHGEAVRETCERAASMTDEAFPSLSRRIVNATKPDRIIQFLRELSTHVQSPTQLNIGGSIALILAGHLSRHTEDIDVVDEVPATIRSQHDLLDALLKRYGLQLAHFQSHYLPAGWRTRLHSVDAFGNLQVLIVDEYDVLVSKLFSAREKDLDDLRDVLPRVDRQVLESRVKSTAMDLAAEPKLRQAAEKNWFILFGQPFP